MTAESLRKEWGLRVDCGVILSGVSNDANLERLWANHLAVDLAGQVASLGVAGVIAPNFTFWKDKPRFHNLWNRYRMLRMCERFAAAGVPVVPHINSTHPADWDFWLGYLREHPELTAVCMEFRTGNRKMDVRDRKIAALLDLSDRLGRYIHPIIVGSIDAASAVGSHFLFYTAIDSTPALKTIHRQRSAGSVDGFPLWRTEPVESGACMAEAFEGNYRDHYEGVMKRLTDGPCKRGIQERKPAEQRVQEPLIGTIQSLGDWLPLSHS